MKSSIQSLSTMPAFFASTSEIQTIGPLLLCEVFEQLCYDRHEFDRCGGIAKCDRCHGDIGADSPLAIPIIAGQDKDYLVMALRAYRDGKRGSPVMHYMTQPYNDAIVESIASHYANQ